MADVCPKCWHEGCNGSCQSAAERKEEANRKLVKQAAARLKNDKKGGKK